MTTCSSIPDWGIPLTKEPGGLQPTGCKETRLSKSHTQSPTWMLMAAPHSCHVSGVGMGSHQQGPFLTYCLVPPDTWVPSWVSGPLGCQRPRAALSGGTGHRVKEGMGTLAPPQFSADAAGKTNAGWA